MALSVFRMCSLKALSCRSNAGVFSRFRAYSNQKSDTNKKDIVKSVFISQSNDIFTNLALEDWLYKNTNFSNQHVLLLWRNNPCVVIGRHQNPWVEANIPYLTEVGIPLARRNSGGGTVYHDRGNLNLSFFSTKENYNRKYNLELIVRALFREFGVNAVANDRDDIVVKDKYKVSGTAAKLGRPSAYHHCTLLVNSNKISLSKSLAKHECGIKTNATQSVRSPICNLSEENNRVTVDGLQTAIGWEFLRTPALELIDGGLEHISKQRGFQFINPSENWFSGINKIREELVSWEWRFGKTPDFSISRSFTVPVSLMATSNSMDQFVLKDSESQKLRIDMAVEKGLISDVSLNIPPGLMPSGFHGNASVVTHLKGKKFTSESLVFLQDALQTLHLDGDAVPGKEREAGKLSDKEQFVANCFDQVMNTV